MDDEDDDKGVYPDDEYEFGYDSDEWFSTTGSSSSERDDDDEYDELELDDIAQSTKYEGQQQQQQQQRQLMNDNVIVTKRKGAEDVEQGLRPKLSLGVSDFPRHKREEDQPGPSSRNHSTGFTELLKSLSIRRQESERRHDPVGSIRPMVLPRVLPSVTVGNEEASQPTLSVQLPVKLSANVAQGHELVQRKLSAELPMRLSVKLDEAETLHEEKQFSDFSRMKKEEEEAEDLGPTSELSLVHVPTTSLINREVLEDPGDTPKPAPKRSLRFPDSGKGTPKTAPKRSIRFTATGDETPKTSTKKSLRFAEAEEDGPVLKATKSVMFADEGEAGSSSNDTKNADGGNRESKKSVKFAEDVMAGPKRKTVRFSIDTPTVARKSVRFLLPWDDGSGRRTMHVFLPGIHRRRRQTVKTSSVVVYPDPPVSLVFHLIDAERFEHLTGHLRAKICRIMAWVIGIVSALVFVLCLVMLVIYLHLHPKIPRVTIDAFDIYKMKLVPLEEDAIVQQQLEGHGNYFAYHAYFAGMYILDFNNTNKRVDIYNEHLEATVAYRGTILATGLVKAFLVARNNRTKVEILIQNTMLLPLDVGYTLLAELYEFRFDFVSEFVIKARMSTIGRLKSPLFWLRVRCYILLTQEAIENQDCRNYNY